MDVNGIEEIYVERSTASEAIFRPQLEVEATGIQIISAFESATAVLNAGSKVARQYCASPKLYRTGDLEVVVEDVSEEGIICLGSRGDYPSANMALVVLPDPNKELERTINKEELYKEGSEFCFIHVNWIKYDLKHDLPMKEGFYRSVRRTFAGLLEIELRQRGI